MSVLAILHPSNLLGKELRDALAQTETRFHDVRLLSTDDEEVGTLTEVAGAAAFVQRYEPDSLKGVDAALFCGPMAASRPILAELPEGTTAVVLSTDALVSDGRPTIAGINEGSARPGEHLVSPHPATILLAHLLYPLRAYGVEEAVATIHQSASMAGEPGIEELFEQTKEIITFSERKKSKVFGAQLAFNLMPTTAPAASEPVAEAVRTVLAAEPPGRLAVHLLQGGFFHGFAASLFVRLALKPSVQGVRKALASHPLLEGAQDPRHLGPIDAANSDKVLVGGVRTEASGGFWIWAVMDNLTRGGVLNALEILQAIG
jgi:aspartate-semialdehyde dehydrogenase